VSRRTETAYKAGSPGKSAPPDEAHGFGNSDAWCGCVATDHVHIRRNLLRMRFARKARFPVTVDVMEQKSAEAVVDKDSATHGSVVAGNNPGKNPGSLTLSKGKTERGGYHSLCAPHRVEPDRVREQQRARHGDFSVPGNHGYCRLFKELG